MGIPERKEKQKLEIKKQILEASMKLFVEEGLGNVTIRRIADLIEYSPKFHRTLLFQGQRRDL